MNDIKELEGDVARYKDDYEKACETIAQMHAAAVGEITGPNRGVVEDVEDMRSALVNACSLLQDCLRLRELPKTNADRIPHSIRKPALALLDKLGYLD